MWVDAHHKETESKSRVGARIGTVDGVVSRMRMRIGVVFVPQGGGRGALGWGGRSVGPAH